MQPFISLRRSRRIVGYNEIRMIRFLKRDKKIRALTGSHLHKAVMLGRAVKRVTTLNHFLSAALRRTGIVMIYTGSWLLCSVLTADVSNFHLSFILMTPSSGRQK